MKHVLYLNPRYIYKCKEPSTYKNKKKVKLDQKYQNWWGSKSGNMIANPIAYPLRHSDFLSSMGVWNNTAAISCIQYSWESPSIFSFVIVLTSLPDLVCQTVPLNIHKIHETLSTSYQFKRCNEKLVSPWKIWLTSKGSSV